MAVTPEHRALAQKVFAMRTAQKLFFKDRDRSVLADSKRLEKEVGALIAPLVSDQGGFDLV